MKKMGLGSANSGLSGLSGIALTFIPSDISSLQLWFDANDLTTLFQDDGGLTSITADGQTVGMWQDKSGNGYHATQATAADKPTYKTGILNNKPALQFLGGGDKLFHSFSNNNSDFSVFIVVSNLTDNAATYDGVFSSHQPADTAKEFSVNAEINTTNKWGTYGIGDRVANSNIFNTNSLICMIGSPSGGGIFYLNGANDGTFADSIGQAFGHIGGITSQALEGYITEILVYNRQVVDTERKQIEKYFSTKWGIILS